MRVVRTPSLIANLCRVLHYTGAVEWVRGGIHRYQVWAAGKQCRLLLKRIDGLTSLMMVVTAVAT